MSVSWWGGRGNPPLSGSDLAPDYMQPNWVPPDQWSYSYCEANGEHLACVRFAIRSAPEPARTLLANATARLDRMHGWLSFERDRAIEAARKKLLRGDIPRRPKPLRNARDAERRAYLDLLALVERYLPELSIDIEYLR